MFSMGENAAFTVDSHDLLTDSLTVQCETHVHFNYNNGGWVADYQNNIWNTILLMQIVYAIIVYMKPLEALQWNKTLNKILKIHVLIELH